MPADTPVTSPEVELIVAMEVALLLHVPPEALLESVVVELTQTCVVPVIALNTGSGLTVTVAVLKPVQPNAVTE